MPTLTMPTVPAFRDSRFRLITNSQAYVSPLSGSVQSEELLGARWAATYTLPRMTRAQVAEWQAMLTDLGGPPGRFFAFDPDAKTPRGIATGTPLVAGASQTGKTLICDGWTEVVTNILRKGDYLEVNGELKMVTADVNSDSAGEASVPIAPALRASPPDNGAIIVNTARAIMGLIDDSQADWNANALAHYGITFSGVEMFS